MGEWATNALTRFQLEASADRKAEELELVRHNKMVAGAEKAWTTLRKFILSETADFNRRMGRQFFTVEDNTGEIEVNAPQGSAKCAVDFRVPEIKFAHPGLAALLKGEPDWITLRFYLRPGKEGEIALMSDEHGANITAERAGARILDPLVK